MLDAWHTFLQRNGARFRDDRVVDFGDPRRELRAALESSVLADQSQLGLIRVVGEDAGKFLQGQLTNDIRRLDPQRSQLSAWCSAKGRVLSTFRVLRDEGGFALLLPGILLPEILRRLRLYVLRARVQLTDTSDALVRFGVSGEAARERLASALGSAPPGVDEVVRADTVSLLGLRGERPRYLLLAPQDVAQDLWLDLADAARPVGAQAWELLELRAGLAQIGPETADEFIPQMLNLQALDGVSFTKGCYTGQEIVARTQYLGKLKRRLYLAHVNGPDSPGPGDAVHAAGAPVGRVVNVQAHPDGGWDLLAVLQVEAAGTQRLLLPERGEAVLELRPLPYPLEEAARA